MLHLGTQIQELFQAAVLRVWFLDRYVSTIEGLGRNADFHAPPLHL